MGDYRLRIGGRIARARQRLGWTQNELARRTGLPTLTGAQISRWERGAAMPSPEHLEALERALGTCLIPDGDGDDSEPDAYAAALNIEPGLPSLA